MKFAAQAEILCEHCKTFLKQFSSWNADLFFKRYSVRFDVAITNLKQPYPAPWTSVSESDFFRALINERTPAITK
jgi:hypothetical protein